MENILKIEENTDNADNDDVDNEEKATPMDVEQEQGQQRLQTDSPHADSERASPSRR